MPDDAGGGAGHPPQYNGRGNTVVEAQTDRTARGFHVFATVSLVISAARLIPGADPSDPHPQHWNDGALRQSLWGEKL